MLLFIAARKEKEDGTLFKGCTDTPAYNNMVVPCSEDWDEGRGILPFSTGLCCIKEITFI